MKKAAAAILLTFYFAISSGIVINMHYCMNRFDSAKFGASKSEVCGKCGMHTEDSNGCCHDEVKVIKLQTDQQVTGLGYSFSAPVITVSLPVHFSMPVVNNEQLNWYNNHSPPISRQYTYLLNCVFRI